MDPYYEYHQAEMLAAYALGEKDGFALGRKQGLMAGIVVGIGLSVYAAHRYKEARYRRKYNTKKWPF